MWYIFKYMLPFVFCTHAAFLLPSDAPLWHHMQCFPHRGQRGAWHLCWEVRWSPDANHVKGLERQGESHYVLYMPPHSLIYTMQRSVYMSLALRYSLIGTQKGKETQRSEGSNVSEQQYLLSTVPNQARKSLSSLHATDQPFTYNSTDTNRSHSTLFLMCAQCKYVLWFIDDGDMMHVICGDASWAQTQGCITCGDQ